MGQTSGELGDVSGLLALLYDLVTKRNGIDLAGRATNSNQYVQAARLVGILDQLNQFH